MQTGGMEPFNLIQFFGPYIAAIIIILLATNTWWHRRKYRRNNAIRHDHHDSHGHGS